MDTSGMSKCADAGKTGAMAPESDAGFGKGSRESGSAADTGEGSALPRGPSGVVRLVDPVTAQVFRPAAGEGMIWIPVGRRKKGGAPICVGMRVFLPDGECFDAFDREVFFAACSLLQAGRRRFTAADIYHTMTGGARISGVAAGRIEAGCLRLSASRLWMEWEEQRRMRGQEGVGAVETGRPVLSLERVRMTVHHRETDGYLVRGSPELLLYARSTRQLAGASPRLLCVPELVNTRDTICIRGYLLHRILGMKNRSNALTSNTILLPSLFAECGIDSTRGTVRHRRRGTICRILSWWCEEGFIEEYSFGRSPGSSHEFRDIRITWKKR